VTLTALLFTSSFKITGCLFEFTIDDVTWDERMGIKCARSDGKMLLRVKRSLFLNCQEKLS